MSFARGFLIGERIKQARERQVQEEERQKLELKRLNEIFKGQVAEREQREQAFAQQLLRNRSLGQAFQSRYLPEASFMAEPGEYGPGTEAAGLVGNLSQYVGAGGDVKAATGLLPPGLQSGQNDAQLTAAVATYPQLYRYLPEATRERIAFGLAATPGFSGDVNVDDQRLQETIRHNKTMEQNIGRMIESANGMIRINPATGAVEPVLDASGQPVRGKMTADQSAAMGFGIRAQASQNIVNALEAKGISSADPRSISGQVPFIGNFLLPAELQQYNQAKIDFVTAVLRKESGAAISASEFVTEDKKYFPQPGDSAAVIAQKRQARQRAIAVLEAQSGRQLPGEVTQPAAPAWRPGMPTEGVITDPSQ